ncbi:MAG: hypothetical protein IH897_05345, partial [Planctomycetes bacterium]|nr:hypothetical protein [Planctomycetota bacterium]
MSVPHVQTKQEIERLLAASGVRPRKRFGQNFLIDGNLMRRVAEVAELSPRDLALEVGAGTGGLTDLLAAGAGSVICVEIDTVLFAIVADRFRQVPTVRLIQGDVLESKHRIHADVGEAIRAFRGGSGGAVKLVANLPYQVATPLVLNLLVDFPQVRRLVFTVQAEVGERLVARPGVKAAQWIERIEGLKDRNLGRLDEIVESWPDLTEERLTHAQAVDYLRTNIHFDLDEA